MGKRTDDFSWLTLLKHPCLGTLRHVQCFTRQDVLLFLDMDFQNCPMMCLYSLQISALKVYSRCGTMHFWMLVWKDALISCPRTCAQAAQLQCGKNCEMFADSTQCCGL